MPYLKLTTPETTTEQRERIARELTDLVVQVMIPRNGRGPSADELRERCTVHFTPYEPTTMAIGGVLMRDRKEQDVTVEFSDWGMGVRIRGCDRLAPVGTGAQSGGTNRIRPIVAGANRGSPG